MSTCDHRFLDATDGLQCTRTDTHSTGHTYAASAGPDLSSTEASDD